VNKNICFRLKFDNIYVVCKWQHKNYEAI